MMDICRRNREEIEREFISLLIHKNEVIDVTQILPRYLNNKELVKMLEYIITSYKKNKIVSPTKLVEEYKDFNVVLFNDIYVNCMYYENAWKQQLKLDEESIIKFYKEDIITNLNKKLEKKQIDYPDFMKNMKMLDNIKLNNSANSNMLTITDIDMKNDEILEYVKSNTKELDKNIKGFALGQLSVWSGSNGGAKSTYLNQIAIESIQQGYNVAIYSGELIAKRLLKWIVMQCAGKKNMSYNEKENYWFVNGNAKAKILEWLNNKMFIYDNSCGNKAGEILSSIKDCVEKNNVKVVILDNLMSMNLSSYGDNKYDVQSALIQDLSALAKELNVHIHFVCHPRKAMSFLRKNDISGSADLTNIADNVFIMHRVNNDFIIKTKETFNWNMDYYLYGFTNVIEVCKNRDFGVEDCFIGMQFEKESKRLKDSKEEERRYGWDVRYEQQHL